MDKKLLEAIARLIKKQVQEEVAKQTDLIRAQIISEVAGMLNYSERKLLTELSKNTQSFTPEPESDFQRAMKNRNSMASGYREIPSPKKRQYTTNPMLNDLLNETGELTSDEIYSDSPSFMDAFDEMNADPHEPWTNESKIKPAPVQRAAENRQTPKTILGTDNRPVNMGNETVQKVMNILNNTDFKSKYEEIAEKGNNFRDGAAAGGVQAPRYNSEYFQRTMVD